MRGDGGCLLVVGVLGGEGVELSDDGDLVLYGSFNLGNELRIWFFC